MCRWQRVSELWADDFVLAQVDDEAELQQVQQNEFVLAEVDGEAETQQNDFVLAEVDDAATVFYRYDDAATVYHYDHAATVHHDDLILVGVDSFTEVGLHLGSLD